MQHAHLETLVGNRYVPPPTYMRDEDFEEIEAYVENLKTAVEEFRTRPGKFSGKIYGHQSPTLRKQSNQWSTGEFGRLRDSTEPMH
jgi:hypothetical protein